MAKYDLSSLGATQAQPSYDLSSLGATQESAAAPSQSFLSGVGSNILNVLGDIGVGGARAGAMATRGVEKLGGLPITPRTDYEKLFGVTQPGMVGHAIESAAQYAPTLLAAGEELPAQILGGGVYGALESPHPFSGAITGALSNLGIGGGPALMQKIVEKARPEAMAKGIMNYLSKGQGFEESGKAVAKGVKNTYERLKNNVGNAYNAVFKATGNESIYPQRRLAEIGKTYFQKIGSKLLNLPDKTIGSLGSELGEKYSGFLKNPTMQKAHDFQSDIGKEIGNINSSKFTGQGISSTERIRGNNLRTIRNSVKDDMNSFIDTKHPELSGQNKAASDLYKNTMVPFHENKLAYQMGSGRLTNPKSSQVSNLFKNPEESFLPLMDEFSPDVKNKVIYNHIGTSPYKLTGKRLLDRAAEIDKQGLNSTLTPKTASKLDNLKTIVNLKKGIAPVVGATLGGIGAHFVHPGFSELGAIGGAIAAPTLMRIGAPIAKIASPIAKKIAESKFTKKAILSRALQSILTPAAVKEFGG